MKKVVFILAIAFMASGINAQRPNTYPELIAKLTTFNESNGNIAGRSGCSGFWSCLGYVCSVVGADIVGAAGGAVAVVQGAGAVGLATGSTGVAVVATVGAVVCGAGASYQAARTAGIPSDPATEQYGGLNIVLPEQYQFLRLVGVKHNQVILNNSFKNAPIDGFIDAELANRDERNFIKSPYMGTAEATIKGASAEFASRGFDSRGLTQSLLNSQLLTTSSKEILDLFMSEYATSVEKGDIERTVNYYIAEVNNSQLSETDKLSLLTAFVVASESPFQMLQQR